MSLLSSLNFAGPHCVLEFLSIRIIDKDGYVKFSKTSVSTLNNASMQVGGISGFLLFSGCLHSFFFFFLRRNVMKTPSRFLPRKLLMLAWHIASCCLFTITQKR